MATEWRVFSQKSCDTLVHWDADSWIIRYTAFLDKSCFVTNVDFRNHSVHTLFSLYHVLLLAPPIVVVDGLVQKEYLSVSLSPSFSCIQVFIIIMKMSIARSFFQNDRLWVLGINGFKHFLILLKKTWFMFQRRNKMIFGLLVVYT